MSKYVFKRFLISILLLFMISLLTFLIVHLMPGDIAHTIAGEYASEEDIENIKISLGLDKPLYQQYFIYTNKVLHGDLGISLFTKEPITKLLISRYPFTLKLALSGLLIAVVLGITFGIISALYANSFYDTLTRSIALVGVSFPAFFLALMLMYFFSLNLRWFPLTWDGSLKTLILPAITIGARTLAIIARITRASMIDVLSKDYILMAKSQGLSQLEVVFKHVIKNVMNTIITVVAVQLGYLLGGAVVTETVFAIPGIGRLLVQAILTRDIPLMQGSLLAVGTVFILLNFAVDVIYTIINPKIAYR